MQSSAEALVHLTVCACLLCVTLEKQARGAILTLDWHDGMQEDEYLLKAVAKWGVKRWAQVAQGLPGRTSKAASHR